MFLFKNSQIAIGQSLPNMIIILNAKMGVFAKDFLIIWAVVIAVGDVQSVHPTGLLCVPTQAVLVGKTIVAVEALNNATSTPVVHENVVCTLNFA